MELEGKVAIVTGGAMGMGRGFAEALLKEKVKVCVADFNETVGQTSTTELQNTYGPDNVIFCKCDITSASEFEETFKKTKETFGRIDIVVNNAGIGGESDTEWEAVIEVNMKGTLRGMRLGMNYLSKENGGQGGVIINMASAAGINPNPFSPVYGCTKAGIVHATRCFAISSTAKESGIRLNVLCPAFVKTPMFDNLQSNTSNVIGEKDQEKAKAFIQYIGVMSIEEAAGAFMDLLKDETKTGAIMKCSKNQGNQYCEIKVENVGDPML